MAYEQWNQPYKIVYNYYIGCVIYSNRLAMRDIKTVNLHKKRLTLCTIGKQPPSFQIMN